MSRKQGKRPKIIKESFSIRTLNSKLAENLKQLEKKSEKR